MKTELLRKALKVTDGMDDALEFADEFDRMDCIKCIIAKYGNNYYILALNAIRELTDDFKRKLKPMLVEGDANSF